MSVTAEASRSKPMDAPLDAGSELVKAERTPAVITTADEYRTSVQRWQQQAYHVLTPVANFSGMAPQHGMIAAVVQVNPDPSHGEVYADPLFCKKDKDGPIEFALAKIALSKIAQAAGISVTTERTDPRTIQNYWEVRATARWRGLDGAIQEVQSTVEYDLRDGSPRVASWSEGQRRMARAHGLRGAEARAINAAIRQFGIKQKYTKAELAKPFVTLRVMFQPDMSDAETRRIVTEHALQGTATLYPSARSLSAVAPEHLGTIGDVPDAGPRHVGSGSTTQQPSSDRPAKPAIPEGMVLIARLEPKAMKRRDNTGTFTKWVATDSNGVDHVTIKDKFGETLTKCFEAKRPIEILSEENSYQENEITELIPGPDPSEPILPGIDKL